MTCELEIGGARLSVDVRRRGAAWEMTLNGRILNVDVTASAGRWSLLVDGRSYEVAVDRQSNGDRIVYVNGTAVPVTIVDPRERLVRRRGAGSAATGPRSIVSPMPGRIVKVLVREGDEVAAQQGLVVVEAMKMENELRAPRAGRVGAVRVLEGASVDGGAVLIVME